MTKALVARFQARTFVLLTDLSTSENLLCFFVPRETLIHKKGLAHKLDLYNLSTFHLSTGRQFTD